MRNKIKMQCRAAVETAKDLLFPVRCPVCADAIEFSARSSSGYGKRICAECIGAFCFIRPPFCEKCGKQLSQVVLRREGRDPAPPAALFCTDCAKKERRFTACRCVMTYEEVEQEILMGIKYKGRRQDMELLGMLAADVLGDWIRAVRPDMIVPVPIHEKRLQTRGYNQAEVLAETIGRRLRIACRADALERGKNTDALKELSAEERLFSLQQAFGPGEALRQGVLKGRRVLLVDDIYTTGATMEACTETLLAYGAAEVFGLCICAGRDAAKVLYN